MSSIGVQAKVKTLFFDRERVRKMVDRKRRRALARTGGLTRTIARRSIRKRKKISQPGRPPHSHEGSLKRGIFFAFEPRRRSVVIGPVSHGNSDAPAALEYGGTTKFGTRAGPKRTAKIRPRPYMGPALGKAQDTLAKELAKA